MGDGMNTEMAIADAHLDIGWYYHEKDARSYRQARLWYRGQTYQVETHFMSIRSLKRKARKMVAEMEKAGVELSEDL
jgi:hypothetical protein